MSRASLALLLLTVGCSLGEPAEAPPEGEGGEWLEPVAVPDPCATTPACPSSAGLVEGDGLVPIRRCAFPMRARGERADRTAVIDAIATRAPEVGLAGVLGHLNRTATRMSNAAIPGDPRGVRFAFRWQDADAGARDWIPQGITTSGDGVAATGRVGGRRIAMVSWYHEPSKAASPMPEKGARIAVVDTTDPAAIRYRHVLLVAPARIGGRASYRPLDIHAGGIAWVGRWLYVADKEVGLRMFDLDRILRVEPGDGVGFHAGSGTYRAFGFVYVLPLVETFAHRSSCDQLTSFVALDRTSSPDSLITGEFRGGSIAGRLFRWPLAANGTPRRTDRGRMIPDRALFAGQSGVQGAVARDGTFWLSSSKGAGTAGTLYRTAAHRPSVRLPWNDLPEDLAIDPIDRWMWSLSEGLNARRYVFAVALAANDG